MRVFILCTGRTGSAAIIRALGHCTNYSAGHESQTTQLNANRLNYADDHIEADNRLSWQLALLYAQYGDEAFYVHLTRNKEKVVNSFANRFYQPASIMDAYSSGVMKRPSGLLNKEQRHFVTNDYVENVNANIAYFLKDRPNAMTIDLDQIDSDFPVFWEKIKAQGNLDAALAEFRSRHNKTGKRKLNFLLHMKSTIAYEWKHFAMWLGLIKS
ncbi:MAG: hypothetical protein HKN39_04885 [Flavobacteriales bacterium]|nr:hypothetical protein [Flavobacteriales bacterium]